MVGKGDELARLSPNGRRILTGGGGTNSVFTLWDASSGALLSRLLEPGGAGPFHSDCYDLQFSPDGRWIAAAVNGPGGRVVVWDAETARVQSIITYADAPNVGWTRGWEIFSARFDSSGDRLVTTGKDCRAVIWDWKQRKALHVLQGHNDWIYSGCFGQRHTNWVLTCSFDRSACLWDLRIGARITHVYHEGDAISDTQFSPEDDMFMTSGLDSTVRLWSSATGWLRPPILRSHDRVMQVCWSATAKRILAISSDGVARVWRLDEENSDLTRVSSVFSSDGLFALDQDRAGVQLRDLRAGHVLAVREVPSTNISVLGFAGGTNRLLLYRARRMQRLPVQARFSSGSLLEGIRSVHHWRMILPGPTLRVRLAGGASPFSQRTKKAWLPHVEEVSWFGNREAIPKRT